MSPSYPFLLGCVAFPKLRLCLLLVDLSLHQHFLQNQYDLAAINDINPPTARHQSRRDNIAVQENDAPPKLCHAIAFQNKSLQEDDRQWRTAKH